MSKNEFKYLEIYDNTMVENAPNEFKTYNNRMPKNGFKIHEHVYSI